MPRVHTHTAKRPTKAPRYCASCRQPIEIGQRYHTWQRKADFRPQVQHTSCGFPKPTQLSTRKTAVVEEAVQDAQGEISGFSYEMPDLDPEGGSFDIEVDDLKSALDSVADVAEEVASEYSEGADNMPESLQYGAQCEAMRDVADRLTDWADELRSWEPDDAEVTYEAADDDDIESDRESNQRDMAEQTLDQVLDNLRSEAESALEDMPEYEG